jgi:hypothetical protein
MLTAYQQLSATGRSGRFSAGAADHDTRAKRTILS